MSALALNAEALYLELLRGVRSLCQANTRLVGITSGGAWLAERLQRDLKLGGEHGVISSALHRDDFGSRGMAAGADHTRLPFDVEGRHIVLVDDVLYAGRTTRAAINVLFDYGRPQRIMLAALAADDIDVLDAALKKIDANAHKYPVHKAKGSMKKYTDL